MEIVTVIDYSHLIGGEFWQYVVFHLHAVLYHSYFYPI